MKLWRHNRLDQEYEVSINDLVDGFAFTGWSRVTDPEMPWPIERRMGAYLSDVLKSAWDVESAEGRADFGLLCDAALDRERATRTA